MNLETIRKSKGLTQSQLDEAAGLTRGTTSDIERGKNANPSWETVRRLSDALETRPEELFPAKEDGNAA